MRGKSGKVMLILGILSLIGGIGLILGGKIIGVVLFLLSFALFVFYALAMNRAAGYRSEGVFFNGIGGQGRQQSEVSKLSKDEAAQIPENIWDAMAAPKKDQNQ